MKNGFGWIRRKHVTYVREITAYDSEPYQTLVLSSNMPVTRIERSNVNTGLDRV